MTEQLEFEPIVEEPEEVIRTAEEYYQLLKQGMKVNEIYDRESGRCLCCHEDTLWGEAPHSLDCNFLKGLFRKVLEEEEN